MRSDIERLQKSILDSISRYIDPIALFQEYWKIPDTSIPLNVISQLKLVSFKIGGMH